MAQILKNNVSGVLGLALGASATSMTLLDASSFPAPPEGDFYLLTLIGLNANGQEASWEIVKVTGKASNTLTVVRAQEGTPAAAWPVATTVQLRLTAGSVVTPGTVSDHVGSGGSAHAAATTSTAGFMSASDKTKLDGVAANANNYSHPTGDGNLHVPATGTMNSGKVLAAGATAGSLSWVAPLALGSTAGTALGTAAAGTATTAARSDHVHPVQTSVSGNAGTATKLATAPTINGVPFDGSANITINATDSTVRELAITAGTTAQYWRGDKSWQALNKSAVGLGNVDNTSDASKPISTAVQTSLNAKQDTLVSGANIKTINGASLLGAGNIDIVGAKPSLQGDPTSYVTQTKTYTITNYNSFSSYAVSASAGTASLSGDTITFTAPASAGNVSLTLTVDGQPATFTVTVQPAGVATPTNTSPADGAINIGASPTLQSSAFATYGLADTHLASRWTVYQAGVQVHSSGWRTDALTIYTVPVGVVAASMSYAWTVEHQGNSLGNSQPSVATSFTTAATFNSYIPVPTPTPANFGDPLEGGFYAGMVWNQITQSTSSKTLATGTQTFAVPNMATTPIVYEGQTVEVRSRANPANKFVGTVTGAAGTNLTINVTSVGGSGTFSDWSVMARHRVIVAPKASGEHPGIALKNANTTLPTACQTLTEGFAATQAMRDADTSTVYPAAHWARGLNIGGKTDWYIPARDELELCWRNLKPTTTANYVTADRPTTASFSYANNGSYGDTANTHGLNNNSAPTGAAYTADTPAQTAATAFRTGGAEAYEFGSAYYWSSSDYNASTAWFQRWQSSNPGYQNPNGKTSTYRVRAVRRSVI